MDVGTLAAVAIFVVTYVLIISERIDRATVAMAGAAAIVIAGLVTGFYTQEEVIVEAIDWNTIGLLLGMMLIVGVIEDTGLFEGLAVYAAKLSQGNYFYLLALFGVLTAIGSMTIDNVTTVLLVAPVSIRICDDLDVDIKPVLLFEAIMANVGGAGTLVGDPPNVLIGSEAGLTYVDFLRNLLPVTVVSILVSLAIVRVLYRDEIAEANRKIAAAGEGAEDTIMSLHPKDQIEDWTLTYKSVIVLLAVTIGFALHSVTGLEPAAVALIGASALLLITDPDMERVVGRVEWTTLLFFAGLFVVVHGISKTGVLTQVAQALTSLTAGSTYLTSIMVLLVSAVGSGVVDNIPFTAAMLPVIHAMNQQLHLHTDVLWWALAMGAAFGGNATYIGSSATVVAVKMSERHGDNIDFTYWLRYGTLIMVGTVIVAICDLTVREFILGAA
ncbi:hypothetical protein MBEHAL_2425 [Halarchaeum acidiphilum MH1-52-1]|uniref:Citrate transporter-like domain-containing protein n=1 Tax=Halarchaeum acidiphilum MH1-52-1 TaxID=1261545 RepID=U2YX89_9EURY|nr:ArsB/NhaD family transporter [Halarchaeum acidiphilum]GAD53665.1 hypothetical protein MBEHAL_2425 [Halarchaeum acidiphilum MH1-52-1]